MASIPCKKSFSSHTTNTIYEWTEEFDKQAELLTWPPNSPDPSPVQGTEALPLMPEDQKDPLPMPEDQVPEDTWDGPTQYEAGGFNVVFSRLLFAFT